MAPSVPGTERCATSRPSTTQLLRGVASSAHADPAFWRSWQSCECRYNIRFDDVNHMLRSSVASEGGRRIVRERGYSQSIRSEFPKGLASMSGGIQAGGRLPAEKAGELSALLTSVSQKQSPFDPCASAFRDSSPTRLCREV